jgi:TRAP-type C4-dicarboxylate transport system substrate-binding protein
MIKSLLAETRFVSEVTDGAVDIKPFPINALIPIKDYLEATRRGAVKVSLFPEGYYFLSGARDALLFGFHGIRNHG